LITIAEKQSQLGTGRELRHQRRKAFWWEGEGLCRSCLRPELSPRSPLALGEGTRDAPRPVCRGARSALGESMRELGLRPSGCLWADGWAWQRRAVSENVFPLRYCRPQTR